MNFEYMPELNWRYGYFVALGAMGALTVGLVWWFRKKEWL
jgi:magnesium transporter